MEKSKAGNLKVFIQNEAGSCVKHLHDEKTLQLKGTTQVSRPYPFPYGFILNTTAADGLNVDCFVLTCKALQTGQVVECDAIALMEQFEDGKPDHNVLAVFPGEVATPTKAMREALVKFVSHVFDHVPGKSIQVGEFRGREAAFSHIARHQNKGAQTGE